MGTLYGRRFQIGGVNIADVPITVPIIPEPNDPALPTNGNRVRIEGDSITFGANATDVAHRYTSLYEAGTGFTLDTFAVFGRSIQTINGDQNSLENYVIGSTSSVPTYVAGTDRWKFFRLGVNDIIRETSGYNSTTFKAKYKQCLDIFISKGWPVNRIALGNIEDLFVQSGTGEQNQAVLNAKVLDYNSKILELVNEYGFRLVNYYKRARDLYPDASIRKATLLSDFVHPNNAGHQVDATYTIARLP